MARAHAREREREKTTIKVQYPSEKRDNSNMK